MLNLLFEGPAGSVLRLQVSIFECQLDHLVDNLVGRAEEERPNDG
jgi:hypothetical protein